MAQQRRKGSLEDRVLDEVRDIQKFYPEITPAIADRAHLILLGQEPYGKEADAVLEARRNQRVLEDLSIGRALNGGGTEAELDAMRAAQVFKYAAENAVWKMRLERRRRGEL